MPIWANLVAAIAVAGAATPEAPNAPPTHASVEDVANSAALCMLAAGKNGVDRTEFSGNGWQSADGEGADYRHEAVPVTVEMPEDSDGVARICVVRASLASQQAQRDLANQLSAILKSRPMEQSDSLLWMVSANGPRGIQLFTDKTSAQPKVRLIGAAF